MPQCRAGGIYLWLTKQVESKRPRDVASMVVRSLSMNVPKVLSFLSHRRTWLSALPERIESLVRNRGMDKKIAQLQARIALLEDSLKGMEELVILVLEREEAVKSPLAWTRPQEMPQA